MMYGRVSSLRLIVDSTGNITKRIDYDSFGNIISDTNPTFTIPFGFAVGLHDIDTGLVRFGARDFDPTIGLWTAKDPIDFAGGDVNLYGYVQNNPVNFIDPSGKFFTTAIGIFQGGLSGFFAGAQNGNIWAGAAGGFAGAIAGGLVGTYNPFASKIAGSLAGGAVGGAVGGATNAFLCNESFMDILKSSLYGAARGVVTGAAGGGAAIGVGSYISKAGTAFVSAKANLTSNLIIDATTFNSESKCKCSQ